MRFLIECIGSNCNLFELVCSNQLFTTMSSAGERVALCSSSCCQSTPQSRNYISAYYHTDIIFCYIHVSRIHTKGTSQMQPGTGVRTGSCTCMGEHASAALLPFVQINADLSSCETADMIWYCPIRNGCFRTTVSAISRIGRNHH